MITKIHIEMDTMVLRCTTAVLRCITVVFRCIAVVSRCITVVFKCITVGFRWPVVGFRCITVVLRCIIVIIVIHVGSFDKFPLLIGNCHHLTFTDVNSNGFVLRKLWTTMKIVATSKSLYPSHCSPQLCLWPQWGGHSDFEVAKYFTVVLGYLTHSPIVII